jgi:hypothetical protein
MGIDYSDSGKLKFDTSTVVGANTKLTIDSGGQVGIGTTSPGYPFSLESATTGLISRIYNTNADGQGLLIRAGATTSATRVLQIASSNDTKIMTVNSNGRVGIGTTTPTAPLHIEGGASSEVLKIEANADPYIRWVENGTNVGFLQFKGGEAFLSNQSNGTFFFRTNNTNRMVITGGGNVGIGSTTPNALLSVGSGSLSDSNLKVQISTGDSGTQAWYAVNKNGGYGLIVGYTVDNGVFGTGAVIRQITSDPMYFVVNNTTTAMTMLSNGKVGIGTTNPTNAKVHIVGDASYVGNYGYNTLTLEDASGYPGLNWRQGNNNWLFRKSGATQELELLYSSNASAPGTGTYTRWLRIEATGMVETINYLKARGVRVGRDFSIGSRATVRLDSASTSAPSDILFGHTAAANESSWNGVYWSLSSRGNSDGQKFHFYRGSGNPVGGTESILMTLDPNLRVGINDTTPEKTLDVNGTFRASSECDLARINFETGGYHGIRFRDDNGNNKFKWGHAKTANEFYLYDYTKNAAVMQLNANSHIWFNPTGNVGINTTNPAHKLQVNGEIGIYNGANNGIRIDTAVADTNTRSAITLFEDDAQATGRQSIDWYNGNQNYYKARLWTEVGSGYGATQFGIDVANDARTVATRLYIRNGDTYHSGDVVAYASDERLKENIRPIQNAIEKVKQIKGVHYTWKDEVEELGFSPTHKEEIGVLAQDVERVAPEIVRPAPFDYVDGGSKTGENYKTVQYEKLVPLLIEAIKEQQKQIDELKARLDGST